MAALAFLAFCHKMGAAGWYPWVPIRNKGAAARPRMAAPSAQVYSLGAQGLSGYLGIVVAQLLETAETVVGGMAHSQVVIAERHGHLVKKLVYSQLVWFHLPGK